MVKELRALAGPAIPPDREEWWNQADIWIGILVSGMLAGEHWASVTFGLLVVVVLATVFRFCEVNRG